jgi:type VI secretion system protein ImpM
MSTLSTLAPPGWFGKLPGLGDFASRRLTEEFILRWDGWLQQGLMASRDALGPQWLQLYLVAPVLRFALAPGVLGAAAWGGVVMPSVDRVGRHFPLTLVAPVGSLAAACDAAEWYDALEACARGVLDLERTVDDFEAALALLPPAPMQADASGDGTGDETGSLWWCAGGPCSAPRSFPALPPPEAFTDALLQAAMASETLP